MGLKRRKATEVADTGNEEYIWNNLEEEDYDARLVYVADLGLQVNEFKGEFKGNFQQISLGIEVIGEVVEDEEGELHPRILFTKPFFIYDNLTERGTELKFYKLFVPKADEGDVPDWDAQLGKAISVSVVHVQGKGENKDKTYDNIAGLSKIPKKYIDDVGDAVAEVGIGDADDADNFVTKGLYGLPKYVLDKRIVNESDDDEEEEEPEEKPRKKARKAKEDKADKKPAKKANKRGKAKAKPVEDEEEVDEDDDPFA